MKFNTYGVTAFKNGSSVVLSVQTGEFNTLVNLWPKGEGKVYVEAVKQSVNPGWGDVEYEAVVSTKFAYETKDQSKVVADVVKQFADLNDEQIAFVKEVVGFAFGQ